MIEVTIKKTLTSKDVAYLIITAFEGGIDYWCNHATAVCRHGNSGWVDMFPEVRSSFSEDGCGPYANELFWASPDRGYLLEADDSDEEGLVLNTQTIEAGLKAMADTHPETIARIVDGQYDAWDADTLVQFAVFGELVYG